MFIFLLRVIKFYWTCMLVKIVDKIDVLEPLEGEGLWAHKLNKHVPSGLNLYGFVLDVINIYN